MGIPPNHFLDIQNELASRQGQAVQGFRSNDPDVNLSVDLAGERTVVSPCHNPRFGDYQSSTAMALGKALRQSPIEIAQKIVEKLSVEDLCSKVEIAGLGFLNYHLQPKFVARQLAAMLRDPQGGILQISNPATIVVDFSSPNIAKSMHVGHIRSTFLGDAISRIARVVGFHVITVNHLGDWGTQFGKLIYGYKNFLDPQALKESPIAEFERLYKEAHSLSESDPKTLQSVRQELAKLQAGDSENLKIWKEISDQSLQEFHKAYERMGVKFDYELGESFYHPELHNVVEELKHLEVARESEGAICIFFDGHDDDPDLKETPMLIQKADGAHLYATTDLAALRHRVKEWGADQVVYVTDSRQRLHFKQLENAASKWIKALEEKKNTVWKRQKDSIFPPRVHTVFGSILGPDKKPIKTRSGDPIKLQDLLDEAESRSLQIIREKNTDLTEEEQKDAARVIGIGALKYADLSQNRNLDYVFDWNKLLALQGNTAPYLIYAYVRIRSIMRNAGDETKLKNPKLAEPEELILAKHLIQFNDAVHGVLKDFRPHLLTAYLYDLACKFSKFYEACPVLKAEEPIRSERLALCDITARALKTGLHLLGIQTIEKM